MNDEPRALQRMEPQMVAPITSGDPISLLAIVARAAQDPACDPGKMRELLAIRKELQAEEAKRQFDEAMALFQSRCPVIAKTKIVTNKGGVGVRFRFAPLDSIIAQTKDLIRECGFSYTIDADVKDKMVTARCIVTHNAGHSITSTFSVPIDPEGYMTLPQKYASALTFSKRYAFSNGFGIMTADEDLDGSQGEKPGKTGDKDATRKLAVDLWNLLTPVVGRSKDWALINQWLWREEILDGAANEAAPDLSEKRLREVIEKAKQRIK